MTSSISQSSDDFSDPGIPSAIGPCIQDDKEFIHNARARNVVYVDGRRIIKGGQRVTLLWDALVELPISLRQRVFLELLQGSDGREDAWLWNEGDEALMDGKWYWPNSPPPWHSAATALERRLARTPPQRREVQSATFEMRTAMIIWLALTSTVYKSADEERGGRDREEWDMRGMIRAWRWRIPYSMLKWFGRHSETYNDQAFSQAMDQAGHSCYTPKSQWVRWWLSMRSQLLPTQQNRIIYIGDSESCAPCQAHRPTLGSESPPSWTPSPALVALRCIWDDTADSRDNIDASCDFSKWLLDQPIYGLTEVNDFFNSLPRDSEDKYLSWINVYPRDLRSTVMEYSLEEWQAMDNCIETSAWSESLNIRSWCAAMRWRMMSDALSYHSRAKGFIDSWCYSVLRWSDVPPPPALEFHDSIRKSGHTCWEEWKEEEDDMDDYAAVMDDYAAAMAFLQEDPKVVGIDVRKDSRCQVCKLQWRLKELGETLPVDEKALSADLTELLVLLGEECSRQNVPWNNILASVQHPDVPRPVSNSDHQEQQVLHYTPAEDDDQGHNMRTNHIDLNVSHRPQPLISRGVHLAENINHIFRPDTNISYVQHNSTSLQHDHHSATAMAITNGIQEQDNVQYPPFHGIQPPSSADVNYGAYGQEWVPYDQSLLQDFEPLRTQVSGRRSTPWLISELVNPSVENDMTLRPRDTFIEGAIITQDEPAAVSIRQANSERMMPSEHNPNMITPSHRSPARHTNVVSHTARLPPKGQMRDEVKKFLTDAMEQQGIPLQYKGNEPKLPWLDFQKTLEAHQVRMIN
ncbi:hypothetical protein C8J56DRAFT_1171531 [Mycena floridula]|nr:hypothetical protein C8J56DRAFT_1171531 [Mycena floridula]